MRDRFTRVLKGHIQLALARFPEGTTGAQLDAFARRPLWDAGLDYGHGTGHGVGSYLSVHEGPQSISPRGTMQALKPGMICSNEPGYYKTGEYGIRIENLVVVRDLGAIPGGEKTMLGFETITRVPDRPQPGRAGDADRRRDGMAQRLPRSRARSRGAGARRRRAGERMARPGDQADLT